MTDSTNSTPAPQPRPPKTWKDILFCGVICVTCLLGAWIIAWTISDVAESVVIGHTVDCCSQGKEKL